MYLIRIKITFNSLNAGKFYMIFHLLFYHYNLWGGGGGAFFISDCFKNFFRKCSQCQMVRIQIRSHTLWDLILVQYYLQRLPADTTGR